MAIRRAVVAACLAAFGLVPSSFYTQEGAAGREPQQPAGPQQLIVFASDADGDATVGPGFPGNMEIFVTTLDGAVRAQLTADPAADNDPVWSPDGSAIAFSRADPGSPAEVYTMTANGTELRNLTNDPADDGGPAWSPDGERIAFGSASPSGSALYAMNADGTGRMLLAEGGSDPAWSPDGKLLAYSVWTPSGSNIFTVPADGGEPTRISRTDGFNSGPAWSPDGGLIAYVSDAEGSPDIWVTRADGSQPRRLTSDPGIEEWPAWSPDGTQIAFATDPDLVVPPIETQLEIMGTDGGNRRTIDSRGAADLAPNWSPKPLPLPETDVEPLPPPREPSPHPPAVSELGVVATVTPLSGRVGAQVLERGGNAVDAAVAATFAAGVTRPDMCGIGGGGFAVVRMADGSVGALDFRETAPAAMHPGAFLGEGIHRELSGHLTVGVPGTVAGLAALVERFGRRNLGELIRPAEAIARDGFPVSSELSQRMGQMAVRLQRFPASEQLYLRDGGPYQAGERLVQAEYADSLAAIADHGPDAFYRGRIARAIVREMEEGDNRYPGDNGIMTLEDLAAYRAIWREPIRSTYRAHEVITMPPPTSGGILLVEMLNILQGLDLRSMGHGSADAYHAIAEAQKLAWADRDAYVGDPDFTDVPVDRLTSKAYAAERRQLIDMQRAGRYAPGLGAFQEQSSEAGEGGHTTHVSVVDAEGNAASITCTIEAIFGSAVVPPGAGFLLNNQLTDFDRPRTANQADGGKRPRSSATPAIVVEDGVPRVVGGGLGGTKIPAAMATAITNIVDFDLDLTEAVDAPRADSQRCCRLLLENGRLEDGVRDELERRGHLIEGEGDYAEFAVLLFTGRRPAGGSWGTTDPRGEWGTAVQRSSPPGTGPEVALIVAGFVIVGTAGILGSGIFLAGRRHRRRAAEPPSA